jgi:hypothetical protein
VIISLNSVNELIFVMVKCGVLFEVRTEFLNIIYTSFCFTGLKGCSMSVTLLRLVIRNVRCRQMRNEN